MWDGVTNYAKAGAAEESAAEEAARPNVGEALEADDDAHAATPHTARAYEDTHRGHPGVDTRHRLRHRLRLREREFETTSRYGVAIRGGSAVGDDAVEDHLRRPVMMTRLSLSRHSISRGPPGSSTVHLRSVRPSRTAATTVAHAPCRTPAWHPRRSHTCILT